MLVSNKIAWGTACLCAAMAAATVEANPAPTNPFRQPGVSPANIPPAEVPQIDVAVDQRADNPFRRELAAPPEVAEGVPEQTMEESAIEPQGKDEVFFPFACDPFASEPATLAYPLAVIPDDSKPTLVAVGAEEVARPRSEPYQKPIGLLGVNISLPKGAVPRNEAQEIVSTIPFAGNMPRPWPSLVYHWEAAATWHQPLYFEEVNAERYGYQCNWVAQPFVSTAHFFGTLPAMPYLMTVNCPRECVYTLGNYRPGSCPPWRRHCIPCYSFGLW